MVFHQAIFRQTHVGYPMGREEVARLVSWYLPTNNMGPASEYTDKQ